MNSAILICIRISVENDDLNAKLNSRDSLSKATRQFYHRTSIANQKLGNSKSDRRFRICDNRKIDEKSMPEKKHKHCCHSPCINMNHSTHLNAWQVLLVEPSNFDGFWRWKFGKRNLSSQQHAVHFLHNIVIRVQPIGLWVWMFSYWTSVYISVYSSVCQN